MAQVVTDDSSGMERLERELARLARVEITVGVHGEDGKRDDGGRLTNVQVAAVHEFGAPAQNIPERSFLRSTMDREKAQILDDMSDAVDHVLQGAPLKQEVERVGIYTEIRVRETIRKGIDPPLSPMTVEKRRAKLSGGKPDNNRFGTRETPLIDTGQLIQSIASKVEGV